MRPTEIWDRTLARTTAAVLAALGFLPIINWMDAGPAAPWYGAAWHAWWTGSAIVFGVAVVAAIVIRRVSLLDVSRVVQPAGAAWAVQPGVVTGAAMLLAFAWYVWIAQRVFSAKPIFVDEIAQLFQANIFLSGRLWTPQPAHPEFFSFLHIIDFGGRVYAQFPPGGPLALAIASLLGGAWLSGPLFGALSVGAFAAYQRVAEPRANVAVGAVLLFALAPFVAFMAGSEMNHVPTLACVLIAVAALARVTRSETPRPALAALSGLAFGAAATIRPVDALAFALPAGIWYLVRALRDRARWRDALAAAAGVAIPMILLMAYNNATTGAPLRFGYEVLWGKGHDLGFHAAPWGVAHTPARGLALISGYFLRLQAYLFESPLPGLVPIIGAFLLTRRMDALDRYWLAATVLLSGLYFAYWHDGDYLGPRFMYLLTPWVAIWTARLPALVRERYGTGPQLHGTAWAYMAAAVGAVAFGIPLRWNEYAQGLASTRQDVPAAEHAAGIQNALVFVRESWGAQIVARLWADGVPRSETEALYGRIDSCQLEQTLDSLETAGANGTAMLAALTPLMADSSHVVPSPFSADKTERVRSGATYTDKCLRRVAEDRGGFTLVVPALLLRHDTNVYARDMHARDLALIAQYPDRPLFLMRPRGGVIGGEPEIVPLARDSAMAEWSTAGH